MTPSSTSSERSSRSRESVAGRKKLCAVATPDAVNAMHATQIERVFIRRNIPDCVIWCPCLDPGELGSHARDAGKRVLEGGADRLRAPLPFHQGCYRLRQPFAQFHAPLVEGVD